MKLGPISRFLFVSRSVCVVHCMCVSLQYVSIKDYLRGEPPISSSEAELAELTEQFHVNAAKCSSLICHDSLCSMVLLLRIP